MSPSGTLLTRNELNISCGVNIDFLTYNVLLHSVRKIFKGRIKEGFSKIIGPLRPVQIKSLVYKSTQETYRMLNNSNNIPTSRHKWTEAFNIEENDWKSLTCFTT